MTPLTLALVMTLPLLAATAPASAAAPLAKPAQSSVMLRESVTVAEPLIRLGDLFANAGDKARVPVAHAPEPGRRAVFDARWLYRLAKANALAWRPLSLRDHVTVERDSVVIAREQIEAVISAALDDRGIDTADTAVELSNRGLRLHAPTGASADLVVDDVIYDEPRSRFVAVVAVADDPSASRVRVTGRLHRITAIPVLARPMRPGERIQAADIAWVEMPVRTVPNNVALGSEDLIGKTPRRGLHPGMPIRVSDVEAPLVVAKGEPVTIVLTAPNMRLTVRGRALEGGAHGQAIRVSNTHSHLVIEAVVSGPGEVTVAPIAGRTAP